MEKKKKTMPRIAPLVARVLLCVFSYFAFFSLLAVVVTPEQYDLQVGEASPITITATKDVQDTVTTQQLVSEAVSAVQPLYLNDATVPDTVLTNLDSIFQRLESVRAWDVQPDNITSTTAAQAREALSPMELTDVELSTLFSLTQEGLSELAQATQQATRGLMDDKVYEGEESTAVQKAERRLLEEYSLARSSVALAGRAISASLLPNMLLDTEATEANRQKAVESIEPVMYIMGQNIVRSGEIITEAQIAMLDSLGMLKNKNLDFAVYIGIGGALALLMALLVGYLYLFEREVLMNVHKLGLLMSILAITFALCVLTQEVNVYFMPVALGAMMVALLLNPRLAILCNVVLAALAGLLASGSSGQFTSSMYATMLTHALSGSLGIAVIIRRQQRTQIMLCGLVVGALNVLSGLFMGLVNNANVLDNAYWAVWSAGSGILSAVLCVGVQPALEWFFKLVTPAKLVELSSPNHPLIRRLTMEASGTYHHSVIVANLAETAANQVGANGLLARVGAYYHDIGKLKRPLYFKENQMGDNPHDRTDPVVSTAILTSHPRDGLQLAQKHRLPLEIQDIIVQHHGDTPVVYFYDRYVKQYGAEEAKIDDFRYDGPRPQSAEAAIIMLADTVEAAARALPDPTPEKMDKLIRKLVRSKIDDEQLSQCPLTLADIDTICRAFLTVLNGVFHERVEYPNVEVPERPLSMPEKATSAEPEAKEQKEPEEQPEAAKEEEKNADA